MLCSLERHREAKLVCPWTPGQRMSGPQWVRTETQVFISGMGWRQMETGMDAEAHPCSMVIVLTQSESDSSGQQISRTWSVSTYFSFPEHLTSPGHFLQAPSHSWVVRGTAGLFTSGLFSLLYRMKFCLSTYPFICPLISSFKKSVSCPVTWHIWK